MKDFIRAAIESRYQIDIQKVKSGPRQKMADTYFLCEADGQVYFCKLVGKPLLVPQIIRSLPPLRAMYDTGVKRIAPPIPDKNGALYMFIGDILVVLYTYIDAPQSEDYSLYAFGRLLGEIHAMSLEIETRGYKEDFHFENRDFFYTHFEHARKACGDIAHQKKLTSVIRAYEREIAALYECFEKLGASCLQKTYTSVMTHGDAPGNVLANTRDDLYLIDWDEIEIGPPERDTWILDHVPSFIDGYQSMRPDFRTDPEIRAFSILKYYFRCLNYYFEAISNTESEQHTRTWIEDMQVNLLDGWMRPKLDEVKKMMEGQKWDFPVI
jgi:hypothetical protein